MWCNQMHVSASVDGFWNIYVNLLRSKWNKHYCWQRRTWIGTHCVLLPFLWWKMTKQELRIIHLMPQHAVQACPVVPSIHSQLAYKWCLNSNLMELIDWADSWAVCRPSPHHSLTDKDSLTIVWGAGAIKCLFACEANWVASFCFCGFQIWHLAWLQNT